MTDIDRINAVRILLDGVKETLVRRKENVAQGITWDDFSPGNSHTSIKRRLTVAREELLKVSKHYG